MAPKVNNGISLTKGKGVGGASSSAQVSALSRVHPSWVEKFETKHKHRIVMKQHVYDTKIVAQLHIQQIVSLIGHQRINSFFRLFDYYNEDLVRVFHLGLLSKKEPNIKFKI